MATQDSTLEQTSTEQSAQASEVEAQSSTGGQLPEGYVAKKDLQALQSKLQKQADDAKRDAMEKANQLAQYQQGYNQLMQRLNEMEVAGAGSDYEKLEVRAKQYERRVAELEGALAQQAQAQAAANARQTELVKLAAKYDVDVDDLDKATKNITEYMDAVEVAIRLHDKKKSKDAEHDEERASANSLDLGGGKVSTNISRLQGEVKKAKESRDSAALMRAQRVLNQAIQAEKKK